jgi:hypothetical protein
VGRLAILEERFFTFVDLETTQSRAIAACLDISGRVYCNNLLRVQFSKRRGQERISQLAKEAGLKRLQETNQQLDNLSAAMGMVEQQKLQQQQQEYSSYYSVEQQRVELPEGVRALTGLTSGARLDDDKIIPRYIQGMLKGQSAKLPHKTTSVADPGCLSRIPETSRIPDPDFYPSRIQKQQQKRGMKKK